VSEWSSRGAAQCINRHVGAANADHEIVEAERARRIVAVRHDHERPAPRLGFSVLAHLGELGERGIDRGVQRGATGRARLPNGLLHRCEIGGQWLEYAQAVRDAHHRGAIPAAQPAHKPQGGLLYQLHRPGHARAGVEQNDDIERQVTGGKKLQRLRHAVFEDFKLILRQSRE